MTAQERYAASEALHAEKDSSGMQEHMSYGELLAWAGHALADLQRGRARIGVGVIGVAGCRSDRPRFILERDGHLTVTIPETVETTAEDLAPALASG